MNAPQEGLRCHWAGCPEEFDDETEWIKHVAVHVFTLKPGERTPWLGPPELDPDLKRGSPVDDNRSDGEDGDEDDDRAFSQINALSSPASTPPQVGLPDSPDLAEKINGLSASATTSTAVEPLRLLSADALERPMSHRTSVSADDVEADLIPTSPTPSINASQNTSSNSSQESPLLHPHILSTRLAPGLTQTQFPSIDDVGMFRRGVFHVVVPARTSARSEPLSNTLQIQAPLAATQTLQSPSPNGNQMNGNDTGWLNTQAFRGPETQDSYDSD